MHNKLPPLPVRIVVAILVLGTIGYFIFRSLNNNGSDSLTASGSIEAAIINIAPEMSGKVDKVFGEEGQPVLTGDSLLSLDSSLLTAQRAVAAAQLDSVYTTLAGTQTKYDQTLEAAIASQFSQNLQIWQTNSSNEFNQPNWYFDQDELIGAATAEIENALSDLLEAGTNLNEVLENRSNTELNNAIAVLSLKQAAFLTAQDVKEQAERTPNNGEFLEASNDQYESAKTELEDAQEAFDNLIDEEMAENIEYARGQVMAARQRYYAAYSRRLSLQTGGSSPSVDTAYHALNQVKTAVVQAQANLDLLDTQLKKLTIYAPIDGVILTRNVELGEFVQPGAVALTMANLNELTITVYVPEDRYGEITLNQIADVMVDSFPDEIFSGVVVYIADQAEFTPRNVQTVEGRSSTVIAIKLKVTNGESKLKIGMPADVVFK